MSATVVFRTEASAHIGTGHFVRCLMLSEELVARGVETRFICREDPTRLLAGLRRPAPTVTLLSTSGAGEVEATLKDERPDWMVVDHYGIDGDWERCLRPSVGRMLVIDDLANRRHVCDLLLDQNYSVEGDRRYDGLVPVGCRVLAGPRYALLAPEYASYREMQSTRSGNVARVLVYFGGSDPQHMTTLVLDVLSTAAFRHLEVDVVIGPDSPQRSTLETRVAARAHTTLHGVRPHLADLMSRADLAIGAGGTTIWERMCLGLPALVVSIAANQQPTCEALGEAGLIDYVGAADSVNGDKIATALSALIVDHDRMKRLSVEGRRLVDGLGAQRVADTMFPVAGERRILVRNELLETNRRPEDFGTFSFAWIDRCDADRVLSLRNAPHVMTQMKSREPISSEEHQKFLNEYPRLGRYDFVLVDRSCDRYVGVFYLTHVGSTPEIGKYIGDVDYLGTGVASAAMRRLLHFCRSAAGLREVTAVTRRNNVRNIALNTRLGFKPSHIRSDDYLVMTLEL